MTWPLPQAGQIKHLSASSISDYLRCSASWYFSRIAQLPQEPVSVMEVGIAAHKALSIYHEGGDYELALLAAWKEMTCPAPSGALERVLGAIALYQRQMQPESIDVAAWWFSIPVPGVPVPLVGEFDLVRADAQDPDHGLIVDWKTGSGRSWTQEKADREIQPTIYWMAYQREATYSPEKFAYWILQTSSGTPTVRTVETVRTREDIYQFTLLCQETYQRMLTDPIVPRCPGDWCRFPEACGLLRKEQGQSQKNSTSISLSLKS